jgi:hypothetical protein
MKKDLFIKERKMSYNSEHEDKLLFNKLVIGEITLFEYLGITNERNNKS